MSCALYLLGGPGIGKSTVMRALLEGWEPGEYERLTEREFFGHYLSHEILGRGLYLGKIRPAFPGTDALSLAVQPHAVGWLDTFPSGLSWVFGEGDRLGNAKFLIGLGRRTRLTVVNLVGSPDLMTQRRASREDTTALRHRKRKSDEQNATFCAGRVTKSANAAAACVEAGVKVVTIDASNDLPDIVTEILGSTY